MTEPKLRATGENPRFYNIYNQKFWMWNKNGYAYTSFGKDFHILEEPLMEVDLKYALHCWNFQPNI